MITVTTFLTYLFLLFFSVYLASGKFSPLSYSYINIKPTENFQWNIRLIAILLIITIISGIRDSYIGNDYHNYLDYYNYILNFGKIGSHFKKVEIGWEYLNMLFAKNQIPASVFFGIIAGLTWYFFIRGSQKYQFLLPLMLYFAITSGFFLWTMSGLRQSVAIMMFFYSIRYIIEKKPLHYIAVIGIASLFHTSALILFPVYFIYKIKFNQKIFFIIYILSLFLIGNHWLYNYMINLTMDIMTKLHLLDQYMGYMTSKKITANVERMGTGLGVLLKWITALYILYMSKKTLKLYPDLNIYFVLFFIGTIGTNIFFSIDLIGRVLNYFNISFFIVIASTIYISKEKIERYFSLMLIIAYFMVYCQQLYNLAQLGNRI